MNSLALSSERELQSGDPGALTSDTTLSAFFDGISPVSWI